jgi:hypothetical protein
LLAWLAVKAEEEEPLDQVRWRVIIMRQSIFVRLACGRGRGRRTFRSGWVVEGNYYEAEYFGG